MSELSALKTRVLVVDDSAYNRQTITTMLETLPGVEVVGRAMNGKEALQLCFDLEPDVITLDIEMPEMDGFSFLRLLMARRPTPVLVVSGYAQRETVFLVYVEGFSYREAATLLDVPIGTVMSRLAAARAKLSALAPDAGGP